MPSLKFVVRKDVVNSDGKANIKLRISHGYPKKKTRYLASQYYIEPRYMGSDGMIISNYPGQANLNRALLAKMKEYYDIIADMGIGIENIDISVLLKRLRGHTAHGSSFSSYMKQRIEDLKRENRFSYAESYQITLDHLERKTGRDDINFGEITIPFLNDFKGYLRDVRKVRVNTIRIYLNNIRAVFYHAIDSDIIKADISPFRKFKIDQERTRPKPITVDQMRQLMDLYPKVTKQQKKALDIFFLIFYLMGINLKDLLFLKHDNLVDSRILYDRFKTERQYSVKVFSEAKEIINRYQGKKYLLRFMEEKEKISPGRIPEAHHDILSQVNKLLKAIKKAHELPFHISTYTPRYSWATFAAQLDISKDVISHALGHEMGNKTTAIYIDYNLEKVDQANEKVIRFFFNCKEDH